MDNRKIQDDRYGIGTKQLVVTAARLHFPDTEKVVNLLLWLFPIGTGLAQWWSNAIFGFSKKRTPSRRTLPTLQNQSNAGMKILFVIIVFLISSTVCSQTNNSAVKIVVLKRETKEPIIDSLVIKLTHTNTTTYRVMADSAGSTMIKLLEPGKYDVAVSVKGYLTQTKCKVIVGEGRNAYVLFSMTSVEEGKTKKRRRNRA